MIIDNALVEIDKTPISERLQKNLLFYLEESEITVTELSIRSGVSRTTIYNYLNQKFGMPKIRTVGAIAMALGIKPSDLFD